MCEMVWRMAWVWFPVCDSDSGVFLEWSCYLCASSVWRRNHVQPVQYPAGQIPLLPRGEDQRNGSSASAGPLHLRARERLPHERCCDFILEKEKAWNHPFSLFIYLWPVKAIVWRTGCRRAVLSNDPDKRSVPVTGWSCSPSAIRAAGRVPGNIPAPLSAWLKV